MSDTNKNQRDRARALNQMFSNESESPDFIKRDSIDEADFETHLVDYQMNPFGNNADSQHSRQYIDDMTSSSG